MSVALGILQQIVHVMETGGEKVLYSERPGPDIAAKNIRDCRFTLDQLVCCLASWPQSMQERCAKALQCSLIVAEVLNTEMACRWRSHLPNSM